MSDNRAPQNNVFSPVVIMLAGLVLLAGSVVSFLFVDRSQDGAAKPDEERYRGIIFDAVAPLGSNGGNGGLGSRVLLMGSMHLLRPADHPLPASYEKAFELAHLVMLELKPGETDGKAELIRQHMAYHDGSRIGDHLSEAIYQRASVAARRVGLSLSVFEGKRPHALAQGLTGRVLARAGFEGRWGVDTYFRERAITSEKRVIGFESLEEQLSVFSSLSDSRQEALLRRTLDQMDQHADYGLRGISIWKAGDVEAMAELYAESSESDPELARTLFEERHARWLPQIEQQLAAGKVLLVIVGAAHLCGDGSLVELLRERGYTVDQL